MASGLKDIKQHCNDLSNFFYYLSIEERSRDWEAVGEWLEIASGIEHIKFDLSKYDKNIGWCGHADLYADKRDLLFQLFVTEIGFFNFLWGSLEALIDIIDPPHVPQFRGKINNSCNYIKNYFPNKMPCYLEILSDLLNCIQSIPMYSKLSAEFKLRPFVNINGVALFVIYKIRNRLAHGALHFPELVDYEDNVENYEEVKLIRLCSRLVLLSIQMLVASYYNDKDFLLIYK